MISKELVKEFVIAGHGNLERVRELLQAHPDLLNAAHDWGEANTTETALEAAGHTGNRAIAEFLLEQGAALNVFVAAMLGRTAEVERFLEADPALITARGVHGISLMYHAALSGDTSLTQMLLDRGAVKGFSHALHAAVSFGHYAMVEWLLTNGADDIDVPNYAGQTPMDLALERGDKATAELLRKRGAGV